MSFHSKVDSKIEQEWIILNIKGFHYGRGGEYERTYANINKMEQIYFVSYYSMTDCYFNREESYCRLMKRN